MPCKIRIRENINSVVEERTNAGLAMSLENANNLAGQVNTSFGIKVVSFGLDGDVVSRDIQIPDSLIDNYFDNEKEIEEDEARDVQREDAQRAGVEYTDEYLFQKQELPASRASEATIEKVKEVIKKMGVSLQALSDYLKGNPNVQAKGANALADLAKGIIAVAQGKEDVALTEEMVHIATAMIEQTNPQIITELISKIDRFKIYKKTLEAYKNDKNYQLSNGKPDIRKIKKEAVDKLITEVIINGEENSTEFPELMQEENRSLVKRMWEAIMDAIRGMYRSTNIDIFEKAAEKIMKEDINPVPEGHTRLYRAEIEKGTGEMPEWMKEQPEVLAQKEAEGRWFYKSLDEARYHADVFGTSGISYIDIPTAEVENYNARDNKFTGGYGRQGNEYFVTPEISQARKPVFGEGVYLQNEAKPLVDLIYNEVMSKAKRMKLFPNVVGDKRHYTFDGKRVLKSVTELIKGKAASKFGKRTEEQQAEDNLRQEWGTDSHAFIYKYITTNLIDENGYRREAFLDNTISSDLSEAITDKLADFAKELISSYPEGTRFIVETMVINEKYRGLLASTIDFMAIAPTVNKDGKPDIKVDVIDWKTLGINKSLTPDIPWFKQKEWKEQMSHYSRMLQNYGVKPTQLNKLRMIPFILNSNYRVKGDRKSGLVPVSVEIGKLDNEKETTLYLLPVVLGSETTGNKKIDALVHSLDAQWQKLYSERVSPEDKFAKNQTLNQLSAAIRHLHVALNFAPLVNVGKTFLNNVARQIKSFENIDYSVLSKEEIEKKLGDLLSYRESAEKFMELDEVFLSQYSKEDLDKEDTKTLKDLVDIAKSTKRMLPHIEDLQRKYVIQLALKKGVVLEEVETEKGIKIQAEAPIGGLMKTFEQPSKMSAKLITLATNLITNSINLVNDTYRRKIKEYEKLLIPIEDEARSKNVKAFSLIGKVSEDGLSLFKKLDKEFWTALSTARKEQNKEFLMNNMDMEKFNALAEKAIKQGEEDLNHTQFSQDKEQNEKKKDAAITKLRNSIDINRKNFDGYEGYQFGTLFNQCIKEEGHLSKEYQGMSEAARNMWQFYTELNQKAKHLGYIEKQGNSFFPLMEATALQKINQSKDIGKQIKEFFTDAYTVKVNEESAFAMIDPETGAPKKIIPKYFTRTDKTVDQLSTDLGKVGAIWLKSVLDYESATQLENTLLTIFEIEKNKGSLVLDRNGDIMFEGDLPKVIYSENKNAAILQAIIDDHLYGLQQDLNSIGNIGLSKFSEKTTKTEEAKEDRELKVRKVLRSTDNWVRIMGVGLKPLIGIANWAGYQFQSFIQAGNFYKFSEFEANNAKITTGLGISTIERALLDMVVPFNENLAEQMHRKLAMKQGFLEYLNTWTFMDVMMSTNRFPERKLQYANALSFINNSMVLDGKIVNIRQYVKQQDAQKKYKKNSEGVYIMSQAERKALEKTYEERVDKLKESSSLKKIAKIVGDEVVIEGISPEAIAEFRTQIVQYNGTLNGQMTDGDKAGFRRDSILTSFMMFKTWIPPLVSARVAGLHQNLQTNEWTYGRSRVFVKTWQELGMRNILKMNDIIRGTDEGLRLLDEMIQAKRADHYRKTGQILEISDEDFKDLIRQELSREMKELGMLVLVMGLVIGAKIQKPPDDATDYEKNRYKWWARAINKVSQEISFYYDPTSLDGVTRGSIMPSIGLLFKVEQLMTHLERETQGYLMNDEEMMKKAYPTKYFLNLVPVGAQFQNEVLPYLSPETAKEMGIRITTQARGR